VYREIKKRHAKDEEGNEEDIGGVRLETPEDAKIIANSVFKQICFHINRNAA